MDFFVDNAVPLSAIALAVLVIVGLVVAAVRGFHLWRVLKSTQKRVTAASNALLAETERMNAALAALPERQEELQRSIASLQARVKVLSILARSASEASEVLRSPLRYLGR